MGSDQIGKILEGQGRKEGESKDPFISAIQDRWYHNNPLGIGKSEEVSALERNLTEEIILDEHFVLKPTEEGVLPESFPKHPVRMDKRMFRFLFSI